MDGWWLVYASDDRLEVVDVERPRIEVAVPADYIERMVIENDLVCRLLLDKKNREISHLVDGIDEGWPPDVALRVRRSLLQLAEFIAITLWPAHRSAAFEDENLRLFAVHVEAVALGNF